MRDFPEHEVYTARDMQWNGVGNGEPLKLMIDNSFDALLTYDKKSAASTKLLKYTITVFVLTATINQYDKLTILTPKIKSYMMKPPMPTGPIIIF